MNAIGTALAHQFAEQRRRLCRALKNGLVLIDQDQDAGQFRGEDPRLSLDLAVLLIFAEGLAGGAFQVGEGLLAARQFGHIPPQKARHDVGVLVVDDRQDAGAASQPVAVELRSVFEVGQSHHQLAGGIAGQRAQHHGMGKAGLAAVHIADAQGVGLALGEIQKDGVALRVQAHGDVQPLGGVGLSPPGGQVAGQRENAGGLLFGGQLAHQRPGFVRLEGGQLQLHHGMDADFLPLRAQHPAVLEEGLDQPLLFPPFQLAAASHGGDHIHAAGTAVFDDADPPLRVMVGKVVGKIVHEKIVLRPGRPAAGHFGQSFPGKAVGVLAGMEDLQLVQMGRKGKQVAVQIAGALHVQDGDPDPGPGQQVQSQGGKGPGQALLALFHKDQVAHQLGRADRETDGQAQRRSPGREAGRSQEDAVLPAAQSLPTQPGHALAAFFRHQPAAVLRHPVDVCQFLVQLALYRMAGRLIGQAQAAAFFLAQRPDALFPLADVFPQADEAEIVLFAEGRNDLSHRSGHFLGDQPGLQAGDLLPHLPEGLLHRPQGLVKSQGGVLFCRFGRFGPIGADLAAHVVQAGVLHIVQEVVGGPGNVPGPPGIGLEKVIHMIGLAVDPCHPLFVLLTGLGTGFLLHFLNEGPGLAVGFQILACPGQCGQNFVNGCFHSDSPFFRFGTDVSPSAFPR